MATIERDALVEFIENHLAEARKAGTAGLRRAVRLAALLGQIWRAASSGTASQPGWNWPGVDPRVADQLPVVGRHRITSRKRVLSEAELRALWPVLRDGIPGSRVGRGPRLVMQLCIVLGLRQGAVVRIHIADLNHPQPALGVRDSGPTLTIRAEDGAKFTSKARREGAHIVLPLSPMASALFQEAIEMRRDSGSPFVFPGEQPGSHLSPGTIGAAWRALRRAAPESVPADARPHDLRRSMRSHLGETDHGGDWYLEELLIGHQIGGAVARAYDHARRVAKMRPVANAWAERLGQIVSGQPAEVHRLHPA